MTANRAHINRLCHDFQATWEVIGRTGDLANTVAPAGWPVGCVNLRTKHLHLSDPPDDDRAYAMTLHELGHLSFDEIRWHRGIPILGMPTPFQQYCIEAHAWIWAFHHARPSWTRSMAQYAARALGAYKQRIPQGSLF